jgi:hypothetical protein
MSGHVALVRTDVSKELSASIIRVTRIGELGRTLAVTVRRVLVMADVPSSPILVTMTVGRYLPQKRRFLQEAHGVHPRRLHSFANIV